MSDVPPRRKKLVATVTRGESTPWPVNDKNLKITRQIYSLWLIFVFSKNNYIENFDKITKF